VSGALSVDRFLPSHELMDATVQNRTSALRAESIVVDEWWTRSLPHCVTCFRSRSRTVLSPPRTQPAPSSRIPLTNARILPSQPDHTACSTDEALRNSRCEATPGKARLLFLPLLPILRLTARHYICSTGLLFHAAERARQNCYPRNVLIEMYGATNRGRGSLPPELQSESYANS
jgi:hypothetical protein